MPRAATKSELITTTNGQWDKMWKMIDGIPGETQSSPRYSTDLISLSAGKAVSKKSRMRP